MNPNNRIMVTDPLLNNKKELNMNSLYQQQPNRYLTGQPANYYDLYRQQQQQQQSLPQSHIYSPHIGSKSYPYYNQTKSIPPQYNENIHSNVSTVNYNYSNQQQQQMLSQEKYNFSQYHQIPNQQFPSYNHMEFYEQLIHQPSSASSPPQPKIYKNENEFDNPMGVYYRLYPTAGTPRPSHQQPTPIDYSPSSSSSSLHGQDSSRPSSNQNKSPSVQYIPQSPLSSPLQHYNNSHTTYPPQLTKSNSMYNLYNNSAAAATDGSTSNISDFGRSPERPIYISSFGGSANINNINNNIIYDDADYILANGSRPSKNRGFIEQQHSHKLQSEQENPTTTTTTSSYLHKNINNNNNSLNSSTNNGDISSSNESDDENNNNISKKRKNTTTTTTTTTTSKVSKKPSDDLKEKRKRGRPRKERPTSCWECKTSTTPEWRRGPQGQSLCNACGIQYSKRTKREKEAKVRHSIASIVNFEDVDPIEEFSTLINENNNNNNTNNNNNNTNNNNNNNSNSINKFYNSILGDHEEDDDYNNNNNNNNNYRNYRRSSISSNSSISSSGSFYESNFSSDIDSPRYIVTTPTTTTTTKSKDNSENNINSSNSKLNNISKDDAKEE